MKFTSLSKIIVITMAVSAMSLQCKTNKKIQKDKSDKQTISKLIIDRNFSPDRSKKLDYKIESLSYNTKNILNIEISYLGGCGTHNFDLIFNGNYLKSLPMQAGLFLKHTSKNETCDKKINTVLHFDITGLKPDRYNKLKIKFIGSDQNIMYEIPPKE
jgi:hypothetical protein